MSGSRAAAPGTRTEPAFPNTQHVAVREYRELVRSRLFHMSTLTLTILAIIVALLPIATRLMERGSVTRVAVVASDPALATRSIEFLTNLLNAPGGGATFQLDPLKDEGAAIQAVDDHRYDGAILLRREANGRIDATMHLGETMGNQSLTALSVGLFGVAFLDFAERNPQAGFLPPSTNVIRSVGGGAGSVEPSAYASRLIVGIVFGFLVFLTIIIYGMWVAAGVVAEKSSRVMELLGLGSDERFRTFDGRSEHREELEEAMGAWCASRTQDEVIAAFEAAEAAIGPVLDMGEISRDPHYAAREAIERPDGGRLA